MADATFQDLVDVTAQQRSTADGVKAFAEEYHRLLTEALANAGGITPEQQAAMNQVRDNLLANNQVVVDALAANVPPVVTPPVTS